MSERNGAASESPSRWTLPKLRVDRNGDWFDGEVQITHPGILANLRGSLRHDGAGYFIQTRVRIPVRVDDVIATDGSWVRNFPLEHAYRNPHVQAIAAAHPNVLARASRMTPSWIRKVSFIISPQTGFVT